MKSKDIIKYILLALGLCLFQFIVLNNLDLGPFIKPQILVMLPLLLPIDLKKPYLLIIVFMLGMVLDFFLNTFGISTFAMVLVAYLRSLWLPKENNPRPEFNVVPSLRIVFHKKWISYALILTVIFHFAYFTLEYFAIQYFFRILLTTIFSALLSIFIQWITFQLFLKFRK